MLSRVAAVTAVPFAALVFAGGCANGVVATTGSVVPSATATVGSGGAGAGEEGGGSVLDGDRLVKIIVKDGSGRALAVGHDDDDIVGPTGESDLETRGWWILRPVGERYQIMLGSLHGDSKVCMEVQHGDGEFGSVRDRVCDEGDDDQLFAIDEQADGSYSLFNGERYVQVVDGGGLVPDLPEGLTTTYELADAGTPDDIFLG